MSQHPRLGRDSPFKLAKLDHEMLCRSLSFLTRTKRSNDEGVTIPRDPRPYAARARFAVRLRQAGPGAVHGTAGPDRGDRGARTTRHNHRGGNGRPDRRPRRTPRARTARAAGPPSRPTRPAGTAAPTAAGMPAVAHCLNISLHLN